MSDNERNSTSNDSDADGVDTAVGKGAGEATAEAGSADSAKSSKTAETSEATDSKGTESSNTTDSSRATDNPKTAKSSKATSGAKGTSSGTASVTDTASAPEEPNAVKATMSSRKAHLTVSRVEPWSVMKFSFVVSLVCFIVLFVAVAVIYATLSLLGVFDELTSMLTALLEGDGGEDELGLNPAAWFSPGRVLGLTGVVGALNIVLLTALATVGGMLYNLVADLVGGVDITLSEAE